MTTDEMVWLSKRLPRAVLTQMVADSQAVDEFWREVAVPKQGRIAAQIVTVELAVIRAGGLKILNRSPA